MRQSNPDASTELLRTFAMLWAVFSRVCVRALRSMLLRGFFCLGRGERNDIVAGDDAATIGQYGPCPSNEFILTDVYAMNRAADALAIALMRCGYPAFHRGSSSPDFFNPSSTRFFQPLGKLS